MNAQLADTKFAGKLKARLARIGDGTTRSTLVLGDANVADVLHACINHAIELIRRQGIQRCNARNI